jgi:hypothetical protein
VQIQSDELSPVSSFVFAARRYNLTRRSQPLDPYAYSHSREQGRPGARHCDVESWTDCALADDGLLDGRVTAVRRLIALHVAQARAR